jgi:hypothetical protein
MLWCLLLVGGGPPAVTLGLPAIITTYSSIAKLILPRHIRIYCYYGYYSANLLLGSTTNSSSNCDTSMCFDLPPLPLPFAFAFALRSRSCISRSNYEAAFRDGFRTRPDRRGSLSLLVPSLSELSLELEEEDILGEDMLREEDMWIGFCRLAPTTVPWLSG